MIYLNNYKDFRVNENWLNDKLEKSSESIKNAMSNFTKPFKDAIIKIKSEWKEEFESDAISKSFIDILNKSFLTIYDSIDKMNNVDDVEQLFYDIEQSIVYFNYELSKEIDNLNVSESMKSYNDYFSYNEAQKSTISALKVIIDSIILEVKNLLNDNRDEYFNIFETYKGNGLDTIKQVAKEFFKKLSKTITNNIKDLDIKKISDEVKAKVETENSESKGKEYKTGTILKYTKKDGDTNLGEVANNQENVKDKYINIITLDGKDKFTINKERIIGESDENGDVEVTPDDITNSLDTIKGDVKKMNKIKRYIENEL